MIVKVDGITSRKELNGQLGIATAYDETKGRVAVRLMDRSMVALKANNLSNWAAAKRRDVATLKISKDDINAVGSPKELLELLQAGVALSQKPGIAEAIYEKALNPPGGTKFVCAVRLELLRGGVVEMLVQSMDAHMADRTRCFFALFYVSQLLTVGQTHEEFCFAAEAKDRAVAAGYFERLCTALRAQTTTPTPAHWETLGTFISCKSLPLLINLFVDHVDLSEGVALLAAGLCRGGLPSLDRLALDWANLGDQGACTLAPALTKRALPSLRSLDLCGNQIGDAGLAALAPGLRQLPSLLRINLHENQIGDQGLISLLDEPTTNALPSFQTLRFLELGSNQISDEGCAALTFALRSTALPELDRLDLRDNLASKQAQAAVMAVLGTRYDSYEMSHEEGEEGDYTSEDEDQE